MLESKGFEDAQDSAKHQAVQHWVAASLRGVGRMGLSCMLQSADAILPTGLYETVCSPCAKVISIGECSCGSNAAEVLDDAQNHRQRRGHQRISVLAVSAS